MTQSMMLTQAALNGNLDHMTRATTGRVSTFYTASFGVDIYLTEDKHYICE